VADNNESSAENSKGVSPEVKLAIMVLVIVIALSKITLVVFKLFTLTVAVY